MYQKNWGTSKHLTRLESHSDHLSLSQAEVLFGCIQQHLSVNDALRRVRKWQQLKMDLHIFVHLRRLKGHDQRRRVFLGKTARLHKASVPVSSACSLVLVYLGLLGPQNAPAIIQPPIFWG